MCLFKTASMVLMQLHFEYLKSPKAHVQYTTIGSSKTNEDVCDIFSLHELQFTLIVHLRDFYPLATPYFIVILQSKPFSKLGSHLPSWIHITTVQIWIVDEHSDDSDIPIISSIHNGALIGWNTDNSQIFLRWEYICISSPQCTFHFLKCLYQFSRCAFSIRYIHTLWDPIVDVLVQISIQ